MASTQETILPNDTLKVPYPMPREIDVVHRTHQRSPIPGYNHVHFKFIQARLGRLMPPKHYYRTCSSKGAKQILKLRWVYQ